jgi:phosphatidylglycerol:prolipoprotein diacylglycerol transferase
VLPSARAVHLENREPDSHLGFIFQWVTMGQLLCIPMIAIGLIMIIRGYKRSSVASS